MVVVAIELLSLGTAGVGWLNGMIGIGATLGVLAVAGVAGHRSLSRYFAVGLLLWGVPLLLIAAWPGPVAAFLLLALLGVGNTLVDVTGITLMQRTASNAVLGRVFGAFEALALVAMGLGALLAPFLVSVLGARGAVLVAGLIMPVTLLPLWRHLAGLDATAVVPVDLVELLRGIPIFAPLPPPQLERLAQALVEVRVESEDVVFEEGDLGDRFYVIADGRADVEIGGERVGMLEPGDFFGEIALLRDVPRTATVRAITLPSALRSGSGHVRHHRDRSSGERRGRGKHRYRPASERHHPHRTRWKRQVSCCTRWTRARVQSVLDSIRTR